MRPYTDLAGLDGYFLEESWVLDIEVHPGTPVFRVELVLTPEHLEYAPRRPNEAYCYRSGTVRFSGVESVSWTGQGRFRPSRDPDGSIDYGNVDSFEWEPNEFHLAGNFGCLAVRAQDLEVTLDNG